MKSEMKKPIVDEKLQNRILAEGGGLSGVRSKGDLIESSESIIRTGQIFDATSPKSCWVWIFLFLRGIVRTDRTSFYDIVEISNGEIPRDENEK